MGALIFAPLDTGSQIAKTRMVQVVDGQQRLTTFQLFLIALREVARSEHLTSMIEQINGYIFNKPGGKDTDPLTRFKLTPTPTDRELFHDLVDLHYSDVILKYKDLFWGAGVPKNTPFPAFRAYILFMKWIRDFGAKGPSDEDPVEGDDSEQNASGSFDIGLFEDRLEALLKAVLERLKLVVINLDENDDAQVVLRH